MLLTLHSYRIMSYEIAETLWLGEASKMKERVLRPLANQGWVRFYEGSFRARKMGPLSLAWGLQPRCEHELKREIETARAEAHKREVRICQLHEALEQRLSKRESVKPPKREGQSSEC
jgi:hypothetical protein